MNDSVILDKVYDWAMAYEDRVLPRDADRRFYDEAVDEVLAILADRVWLDSEGVPVEPDDPNAVAGA